MSSSTMTSLGQAAWQRKGQAQQHDKEKAEQYFQQKTRAAGGSGETMQEWKPNSLCDEYDLPANNRGHIYTSGGIGTCCPLCWYRVPLCCKFLAPSLNIIMNVRGSWTKEGAYYMAEGVLDVSAMTDKEAGGAFSNAVGTSYNNRNLAFLPKKKETTNRVNFSNAVGTSYNNRNLAFQPKKKETTNRVN